MEEVELVRERFLDEDVVFVLERVVVEEEQLGQSRVEEGWGERLLSIAALKERKGGVL